jgi:hypothetical protein
MLYTILRLSHWEADTAIDKSRLIREINRWENDLRRAAPLTWWLAAWLVAQPWSDPRHAYDRVICVTTRARQPFFGAPPG